MTDITEAQKKELLKIPEFKAIRQQYTKEQKMVGAGKKTMKGRGFWDDVGNWFYNAGQSINDFLKRTKLLSNVAGAVLPILAPLGTALLTANPLAAAGSIGVAKAAAEGIKSLGYGKMKGKGFVEDAQKFLGSSAGVTLGLLSGNPALTSIVSSSLKKIKGGRKMRGGDARLAIQPEPLRLRGLGGSISMNGSIQQVAYPRHSGIMGNGAGTEFNTVSSAFGVIGK